MRKKIKHLIIVVLMVMVTNNSFTQSTVFLKSYGNTGYDYGRDIKQTLDTGYIATGSSSSFGSENADVFLMKIDSVGNFLWSYNYGGEGSDWGEGIVLTQDSGYAVAGYTNSYGEGGFDFYLIKTDINGNPLWEKTYGGTDWDKAYALKEMPDSGFVLVGETYSYGEGSTDIHIVRVDKNGLELWSKTYGGEGTDFATDLLIHGDSIVVVGSTDSEGAGNLDGILLKYDFNGNLGSKILAGKENEDIFNSIKFRENYYLIGGGRSYNNFEECDCGMDFWVYKIDTSDLHVIADTTWSGSQPGRDIINDLAINNFNDIYYAGTTTSWGSVDIAEGYTDAFVNKILYTYYTAFDYIRNFGELGNDYIKALDFCYDEGLVGIGTSPFDAPGGSNIIIFRNDAVNSAGTFSITDLEYDVITLDLKNQEKIENLTIYPTLVKDEITITGINDTFVIRLLDLNGKVIFESISYNNLTINTSNISSGYYILNIQTNGKVQNVKIFKE
ncbi:T9SS type A sorting domain-containing protein [Crocinitomix algicola]|uniref:T9SS type A sorting domain-containing protein n=1 Tax=Crocinitomix algicola TaxID=1740263 RepID=UPI0008720365|nr:T9SS type A sorting domain-containing protein [Crocinitomix algicola]